MLTIGKVAQEAGVGVETVRFYERKGLVEKPSRPHGSGFRRYPAEAVSRICFIKEAQKLGFTLAEIRELLALRADANASCRDVQARALAKLRDVRAKIEQLERIGAVLESLVAGCPGSGGLGACSIMGAFTVHTVPD